MSPSLVFAAIQAITIAGGVVAILMTRADTDLWGHLKFGADILWSRALPAADPYSFTSDRAWVNHEWLSEVALAAVYGSGGAIGLIAFKSLMVLAGAACIVAIAWRNGTRGRPFVVMAVLTVVGMSPRVSHVRPQLVSVVCFAVLLNVLYHAGRGRLRALVVIPPMFVVWANAHGGWLVGLATVWAWSVGELWRSRRECVGYWAPLPVIVSLVTTLATLATPYGVTLWSFLVETVGPSRAFIAEWGPITGVPLLIVPWLLFWVLLILAIARGGIPPNPAKALIPIALGLASAKVSRLDTFFALSVLGLLSQPVAEALGRYRRSSSSWQSPSRWQVATMTALIAVALAPAWRSLTCIELRERTMPEPEAIQMVQSGGFRGRMITFFNWGEFAIWYLPPGLRISMDGRRETVYSQETVNRHLDLYRATEGGLSYLQQLNPDYVWLPNQSPMVPVLEGKKWTAVYRGNISTILARDPIRAAAVLQTPWVASTEPGPRRCFPGP